MKRWQRLGEILVEHYRVLPAEVETALGGRGNGHRVGQMLVRMGALTDRDLMTALAQQLGIPVVLGLPRLEISEEVLALVPMRMAERKLVVPVEIVGSPPGATLVLAMADPTENSAVRALEGLIGIEVRPAIAPEEDIRRALKVFYFRHPMHRDLREATDSFEVMRHRMHELSVSGPIPHSPDAVPSTSA